MNVKEILESGLLEDFVFGNPSQNDVNRIENWIDEYPQLIDHILALELTAEKIALDNAIAPQQTWKNDILSGVLAQNTKNDHKNPSSFSNALGHALSLILGTLIGAGLMFGKIKSTSNQFKNLEKEYVQLSEDCTNNRSIIATSESLLDYIQHHKTEAITLSQQGSNQNSAVVFWNPEEKRALASIEGLASLQADQSYQIWADVNGEMISIGLLDQAKNRFVALNYIENAESLNITIEPKGGSDHPTVSRLIMSAKV